MVAAARLVQLRRRVGDGRRRARRQGGARRRRRSAAPTPQLEDRANRLANHLLGVGVGPGDHVGLYLENCPEYLEAMIACFKIRAVPININHRYVAGELEYLLDDSDAVGVLHGPQHRDVIDAVLPNVPGVALVARHRRRLRRRPRRRRRPTVRHAATGATTTTT